MLSLSVLLAIPLLALNLRPAVTSVGAVLADIRADSGMSGVLASIVVAAPVWCFALGGGLAYKMRAAWGTSRTLTLALVMLAATLATRVIAGPYLLLAGTVVACLSIAVLGTLLPVITHAAPTKAWALLTGCYVAAMGGGSGLGALITPQVASGSTWQWGVSAWALLAAAALVAWRVATKRFTEPAVAAGPRPSPFNLRPPSTAWSTTIHFGLTSGFTFTIMGWLPSILLDHSHVDPAMVGWMFGVAMALGVPIALLVPKWARASQSQSALAVVLCVPNMLAMGGLLLYPEITPWVWAVALGLGMPAVGLGLTLISLRAAPDGDTAAALSSMVQGFGYAIAGVTALGAGLLHSSTQSWEWPLIGLLAILCGQLITGMHAGLPTTVYSGRRFAPSVARPEPRPAARPGSGSAPFPQASWQVPGSGPLPMSGAGVGWGPPKAGPTPLPVVRPPGTGSGPRPFPSPRPAPPEPDPITRPVTRSAPRPTPQPVEPVTDSAEPSESVTQVVPMPAEPATQSVEPPADAISPAPDVPVSGSIIGSAGSAELMSEAEAPVESTDTADPDGPAAETTVANAVAISGVRPTEVGAVDEVAGRELVVSAADAWVEALPVAGSIDRSAIVESTDVTAPTVSESVAGTATPDVEPVAEVAQTTDVVETAEATERTPATEETELTSGAEIPEVVEAAELASVAEVPAGTEVAGAGSVGEQSNRVESDRVESDFVELDRVEFNGVETDGVGVPEQGVQPHSVPMVDAVANTVGDGAAAAHVTDHTEDDAPWLLYPQQEALFQVPGQEALFEIPLPRQPFV
ncbi:MFS transporter [Actinophytocola sediminis]